MFSGTKRASDNGSATFVPEDQFVIPRWYAGQEEWICDPHNSDSVAYNYFAAVRLRGALRQDVLQASLDKIVRRHGVLRSIFKVENGCVSQIVLEPQPVVIRSISLKKDSAITPEMQFTEFISGEINRAFDLAHEPAFRPFIAELGDNEYVFVLGTHHLVCDDWSISVFFKELAEVYSKLIQERDLNLQEEQNYASYSRLVESTAARSRIKEQLKFWDHCSNWTHDFHPLSLSASGRTNNVRRGESVECSLTIDQVERISSLAGELSASLFMLLLTAGTLAITKRSGKTKSGIATCVANRPSTELEDAIGPFSNRVLLLTDFTECHDFREVVRRVRDTALNAYSNQEVPFGEVAEYLGCKTKDQFFQTLFVYQNALDVPVEFAGISCEAFPLKMRSIRYPLNFWVGSDSKKKLKIELQYDADCFARATAQQLLNDFQSILLEAIGKNDEIVSTDGIAQAQVKKSVQDSLAIHRENFIEQKIVEIWRRVLNDPSVSEDSNFFDSGGDSLKAVRMLADAESALGKRLAPSVLLAAQSPKELAVAFEGENVIQQFTTINVQTGGRGTPLFCIHSHNGSAFFAGSMRKWLGPDQPIYALESFATERCPEMWSIEGMARFYVQELRNICPRGPYNLMGFCFGGLVAIEMARLLSDSGEDITLLGMCNTPSPGSLTNWPFGSLSYLGQRAQTEIQKLKARIRQGGAKQRRGRGGVPKRIFGMVERTVRTEFWRLCLRIMPVKVAQLFAGRFLTTEHIHIAAAKNYRPRKAYRGNVILFLSEAACSLYSVSPKVGWREFVTGQMEVFDLPPEGADFQDLPDTLTQKLARFWSYEQHLQQTNQ